MDEKISSFLKYNLWNGNTVETGMDRPLYTDKISQFIGNKLVKVLVGQRRAGKSYILRQIAKTLITNGIPASNIFYINKEYMEYDFISTYTELQSIYQMYRQEFSPQGKVYLFIDEIQYINGWEKFVNSHSQDFSEPCEIFISGSNSELLSGELATLLSGRYIQFEIYPYSFNEFCNMTSQLPTKAAYLDYIQGGSLPELFNLSNDEMKRNYMASVKDTVMLRDIVKRFKVKDIKLLEDVFTYLVNSASSLISITNIINFFSSKKRKTNYETISSYISYLESSFLVHKAERYNIKGKETVAGNCKYYINDLGFHNFLYPGFGYGIGYLLENAVYLTLLRAGYSVYTGNIRDKEVDFVARKADKVLYIQCTYQLTDQTTIEREYASLEAIDDNYEKIVVSLDDFKLPSKEGIKHIQAWELTSAI